MAFNLYRFSRKVTNEIISTRLPTPSTTVGFALPHKRELIKDAPRALKQQERDVSKTKGISHNQEHFLGK